MTDIELIGVYFVDGQQDISLVELLVDKRADEIDLVMFSQEIEGVSSDNWQVPFSENYLSIDGDEIIGDGFDLPKQIDRKTRLVFFIYFLDVTKEFKTPFGDLALIEKTVQPERLRNIIEFQDPE